MKRFWQTWLAIVASVAMGGLANAQNDWNQPAEIGSYQSILSRAGYGADGAVTGQAVGGGQVMGAPVGGGQVMGGGQMMGAPMTGGGQMMGGAYNNGYSMGAGQMMGGYGGQTMGGNVGAVSAPPMPSVPMTGTSVVGSNMGSVVDYGNAYNSVVANTVAPAQPMYSQPVYSGACAQPAYSQPVYSAPVYSQPVYAAPVYTPSVNLTRPRANFVVGVFGLLFDRDYEDRRELAVNPSGQRLYTDQADHETMDGVGVSVGRRKANGKGSEVRYWALNPGQAQYVLNGAPVYTTIDGFADIYHGAAGASLFDIYGQGVTQRVVRDTDINSLSFNLLQNGGCYCNHKGRRGNYELLAGFRWFQFDETLQYISETDTVGYPTFPSTMTYESSVTNTLLGFQLGARNEICLSNKLRLFTGVNAGLFNNNVNVRQRFFDETGYNPFINSGPFAGNGYDFRDEKNDAAFLGELDLGLIYQISCRARLRFGYRALGLSGIALAGNQLPYDYTDQLDIQRAKTNGNLLLHGGYYGLEFCF